MLAHCTCHSLSPLASHPVLSVCTVCHLLAPSILGCWCVVLFFSTFLSYLSACTCMLHTCSIELAMSPGCPPMLPPQISMFINSFLYRLLPVLMYYWCVGLHQTTVHHGLLINFCIECHAHDCQYTEVYTRPPSVVPLPTLKCLLCLPR